MKLPAIYNACTLTLATVRHGHDTRGASEIMEFVAVVHSTNKSFLAAHGIVRVTVCVEFATNQAQFTLIWSSKSFTKHFIETHDEPTSAPGNLIIHVTR